MRNIWVALVLLILVCVMGCGEYGGGYKSPQDAPNRYKVVYDTGRLTDLKLGYLSTEGNIYGKYPLSPRTCRIYWSILA